MKSNRLFATAALLGAISFAMPIYAHAEDSLQGNSVESGAKEMYHGCLLYTSAAARAHRSAHVAMLEVLRADRIREHDRHRDLGRDLARRESGCRLDLAGARRGRPDVIHAPCHLLFPPVENGTLSQSDNLKALWERLQHISPT